MEFKYNLLEYNSSNDSNIYFPMNFDGFRE